MTGSLPLLDTMRQRSGMPAFAGACLRRALPVFPVCLCASLLVLAVLPGFPGYPGTAGGAERLTVAAAASLQHVFRELALQFREQGGSREQGGEVTLVFGASGSLAHQIENGAPYTVFASANEEWVARLVENGQALPGSLAVFGEGVLALVLRDSSLFPRPADPPGAGEGGNLALLRKEQVRFIAIANPKHAPYGMAARDALLQAGLWKAVKDKLVFGDNVRQALTYLETENADAAFVAASLLGRSRFPWRPVPSSAHRPIRYTLCLLGGGRRSSPGELRAGRRFVSFLLGRKGRAILARYGINPPRGTLYREVGRLQSGKDGS